MLQSKNQLNNSFFVLSPGISNQAAYVYNEGGRGLWRGSIPHGADKKHSEQIITTGAISPTY